MSRVVLFLTLLVSAALKFQYVIAGRNSGTVHAFLRGTPQMAALIVIEMMAAALLLTRWYRAGCLLGGVLAGGGVALALHAKFWGSSHIGCGCLGDVVLSPAEHALLASIVAVLALHGSRGDSRTQRGLDKDLAS